MTRRLLLPTVLAAAAVAGTAQPLSRAQEPASSPLAAADGAAEGESLPETLIDYSIEVALEPDTRVLDGRETIRWTNRSVTATVARVPVHLYLNAFANEASTWMRSVPAGLLDVDALVDRHGDPWGWSEPRSIRQDGTELAWRAIQPDDGNPLDRSLIEIELAEPVEPGGTLVLEIDFDARLPVPIARTGGYGNYFMVAQWFPKIAAFETAGTRGAARDGFNAHQFHGQTEFYANYADFDVRIGVPPGWSVAATGRKAGDETREGNVWHRYRQRAVHDFAFAAGTGMVELVSSHDPAGAGDPVDLHLFVPRGRENAAERWRTALAGALDALGSRVGPYPYDTITLVQPPYRARATGGMEYPTLFTGFFDDELWDLPLVSGVRFNEFVIAHEFAHQYFYGLVGSNEFEEAFLDEGFSEYWALEALIGTYPDGLGQALGRALGAWEGQQGTGLPPPAGSMVTPVGARPTYSLRGSFTFAQVYTIPALTLKTLENLHGRDTVDRLFAAFYERWRFRHPRLEDFIAVAREVAGDDAADFIAEAYSRVEPPDYRIEVLEVQRWRPPRGRVLTDARVVSPAEPREGDNALAGLDPAAHETAGTIVVERLDPGDAERNEPGGIERLTVAVEERAAEPGWQREPSDAFFVSRVRVAGPGWDHLPVEIEFRFADGITLRERWDGRSPYRIYRFVRPAPLAEAWVDPRGAIVLDPDVVNNGLLRTPDRSLARDWAAWIAGAAMLLAEGLAQWL